ncbi:MAG: hypothetical protein ACLFTT_05935 [Candidatus Hydrogenedentota bacterium]
MRRGVPLGKLTRSLWERARPALMRDFPALPDLVKGRVVVSEEALAARLREAASDMEEVDSLTLRCHRRCFVVGMMVQRGWFHHRIEVPLAVERFRITRDEQQAVLCVQEAVAVAGRNVLGRLSAALVQGLVSRTLRSRHQADVLNAYSHGFVTIDWPRMYLHLDRLPAVRLARTGRRFGMCLLDVVAVTGCEVRTGEAVIHLERQLLRGRAADGEAPE